MLAASCSAPEPEPYGPVPTRAQMEWQRMEMNMFCHFGPNTFSGAEWGDGNEPEDLFRPTALDCGQWVRVAARVGMGGIILTAKHHDGFCLWPSAYSTHTVAQSTWRGGQGDVLRELRTAIDEYNSTNSTSNIEHPTLKLGVYISPWDRNHPAYGTDRYNDIFDSTLREVHRLYGPMFEQWFDGACGEGPNGKRQRYDWPRFMSTMAGLNPACVVFSDVGPGCRWVGNEEGRAGETCWSTLCTDGATPSENKPAPEELTVGHGPNYELRISNSELRSHNHDFELRAPSSGLHWIPAEVDVSLRPGWFWHADEHPKSVAQLVDIYFSSVGRNGLLLLNVPPDTAGRICAEDSAVLMAFRAELDRLFAHDLAQGGGASGKHRKGSRFAAPHVLDTAYDTYWASDDTTGSITILLDSATTFDIVMLQEYIPLGQRICEVSLQVDDGHGYLRPYDGSNSQLCTTVGNKRLVRLPEPIHAQQLVLTFKGYAPPIVNRVALYNSAR